MRSAWRKRRERRRSRQALHGERALERAIELGGVAEAGVEGVLRALSLASAPAPAAPPRPVRDDEPDEPEGGDARHARDAVERAFVRAAPPHRLVLTLGHLVEDANLLPEVVADDVPVPALRGPLDEVAHVHEEARRRLERLRAGGRRGVEGDPRAVLPVAEVGLHPGVRVALADGVVVPEAVVGPADESRDVAGGNPNLAKHERHRGREELAVPASRLE